MELLGETRTPDGAMLTLTRQDREYIILADGKPLMSSRMHGSEEALAAFACAEARTREEPCVLIGGLERIRAGCAPPWSAAAFHIHP